MPHMRTSSKLAALAEDQWGLLTRRQAEASGVSRATLQRLSGADGPLERMTQGDRWQLLEQIHEQADEERRDRRRPARSECSGSS